MNDLSERLVYMRDHAMIPGTTLSENDLATLAEAANLAAENPSPSQLFEQLNAADHVAREAGFPHLAEKCDEAARVLREGIQAPRANESGQAEGRIAGEVTVSLSRKQAGAMLDLYRSLEMDIAGTESDEAFKAIRAALSTEGSEDG